VPKAATSRSARIVLTCCALALISATGHAQGFRYSACGSPPINNLPYDGKFTFARLVYSGSPGNCYYRGEPSWAHGYGYTQNGTAEANLMQIMASITTTRPHRDGTNAIRIDDPKLTKYPVAFMTEAGYLTLSDGEVKALHDYLMKGGFLIIDDSREDPQRGGGGWRNLTEMMALVLPGLRPLEMSVDHPIFHAFYDIPSFGIVPQDYDRGPPIFRGIFEGNDPKKRLMVMINFNTDISNFWEFSSTGLYPVDLSNEAYKLGVNYLIYALTH